MKQLKKLFAFAIVLSMLAGIIPASVIQAAAYSLESIVDTALTEVFGNGYEYAEPSVGSTDAEEDYVESPTQDYWEVSEDWYTGDVAITPIYCGKETVVDTDISLGVAMLCFVPDEDGTYAFYSFNNSIDPLGHLYDVDRFLLGESDDGGDGYNFRITYFLNAGATYYLMTRPYNVGDSGKYSVMVEKLTTSDDYWDEETWEESVEDSWDEETWEASDEESIEDLVATPIYCGKEAVVTTDINSGVALFEFVPEEDGTYAFYSFNNDFDTRAYLYDADMYQLDENDDGGDGYNFRITYSLNAGSTYYLKARPYSIGNIGEYSVMVEKLASPTSIELYDEKVTGVVGNDYWLDYYFLPEYSAYESVVWSSDNTSVATVDENGYVYFVGAGTAIITATTENGLTDSAVIAVKDYVEIYLDDTVTVEITDDNPKEYYKFIPTQDGYYNFTVNGESEVYCHFSSEGLSHSRYGGQSFTEQFELNANIPCYISASLWDGDFGTYTLQVTKAPAATSIELYSEEVTEVTGVVGSIHLLGYYFLPEYSARESVVWSSDNTSVATVDEDGHVYFVGAGTAIITVATENGLTDSVVVTVKDYTEIYLDDTVTVEITEDNSEEYYKFIPTEDGLYNFTVNSEYYTRLYIKTEAGYYLDSASGYEFTLQCELTANEVYNIQTYLYWGDLGSYTLQVANTPAATSIELDVETLTGVVGGSNELYCYFFPMNCAEESVVWSSDNTSVATVNEYGNVYFVGVGTAIVTATTENGLADSVVVTVKDYVELYIDDTVTVEITDDNPKEYYKFIPAEDGYYNFTVNGESEAYCFFYSESLSRFYSGSFTAQFELTANTPCYVSARLENGGFGTYTLQVSKASAPTSIELSYEKVTGVVGGDYWLDHCFLPEYSAYESIVWSSDNTSVATVDENGYVYFVGVGTAIITATTENGLTDSVVVTVKDYTEIYLDDTVTVEITEAGEYEYYKFIPTEDGLYNFTVNSEYYAGLYIKTEAGYRLDSASGYEFTLQCELTANEVYNIQTYLYWDDYGTYTLQVTKAPAAASIDITDAIGGYVGFGKYIDWSFYPEECVPESITWSIDNEKVATLDDDGYVHFVGAGTATITATTENGLTDTCTVTVKECQLLSVEQPVDVSILDNELEYIKFIPEEGGYYRIYGTAENGGAGLELYSSSMNWLLWAADSFDYRFEAGETYYIGVNYDWWTGGEDYGCGVMTVSATALVPATSISFDFDEYSGYVGEEHRFGVVIAPENAVTETLIWSSDDESVVSVDGEGYIRLLKEGTATITVTNKNGLKASYTVVVKDYETITLNQQVTVTLDQEGMSAYFYLTPEEDGYYAFYSSNNSHDTYGYILDADMYELASDDDSGENGNFRVKYEMKAGVTYILRARFYSSYRTGSFDVCVEMTNTVTGLELVSMPNKTEYIRDVFDYSLDLSGLKLRATWTDGTVTEWACNDEFMIGNEYLELYVETVGDDILATFYCGVTTFVLTLKLVENPVDHLELVEGPSAELIENFGGQWEENENGKYYYYYPDVFGVQIRIVYKDGSSVLAYVFDTVDGYDVSWRADQRQTPWVVGSDNVCYATYLGLSVEFYVTVNESPVESLELISGSLSYDENTNGYWDTRYNEETGDLEEFFYYRYEMPSDTVIQINYKDGTSVTTKASSSVDGYYFSYYDNQGAKPWVAGGDNYLTLSYLGVEVRLPVYIVSNPVERIELISAPTREYTYGDLNWGWLYSDGSYEFHPSDLTGLSFAVYFTDGTVQTFTSQDMDDNGLIGGYGYSLNYDSYDTGIGDFPVTFEYRGFYFDYTVRLNERVVSEITSIEIASFGRLSDCSGRYLPDMIGSELCIRYSDDTCSFVAIEDYNLSYNHSSEYELVYEIYLNGEYLTLTPYFANGSLYFTAEYRGQSFEVFGFNCVESNEIVSVDFGNANYWTSSLYMYIYYAGDEDGVCEEIVFDVIIESFSEDDEIIFGHGLTYRGILPYTVEMAYDSQGDVVSYTVNILGHTVVITTNTDAIEIPMGDVTGNGVVSSLDAYYVLRYDAGLSDFEDWAIDVADVNGDGRIDSIDAWMILKYDAGLIEFF